MKEIRFFYNGLKVNNGKLQKAYLSYGENTNGEKRIYIYARNYTSFCKVIKSELEVKNDSDSMTDYFESDRIVITPENKYWNDAAKAIIKDIEKTIKRITKRKNHYSEYHFNSEINNCRNKIAELSA